MLMFILALCLIVTFLTFVLQTIFSRKKSLRGEHVLISGGSSGIGKSLAIEAAKRGANITILARNQVKLEIAQAELEKHLLDKTLQSVQIYSVDVGNNYNEVEEVISKAESKFGAVTYAINCAGYSVSGKFEELPVEQFQQLLQINYMGSVFVTRAVMSSMKSQNKGHIVFTSSQAGLAGIFGFSAYSASKFALRGLAESLQMEVAPYNIKVTVAFPPDTDTPGFAEEEKTKPIETKLISQASSLVTPDYVAKVLLEDVVKGKFMSTVGLEGSMLVTLCAGMSPVSSLSDLITQICTMGIFRLISVLYLLKFDSIVKKHVQDKNKSQKTE